MLDGERINPAHELRDRIIRHINKNKKIVNDYGDHLSTITQQADES